MELLFWISLFIVFYTYIGYGMLLFILIRIKRMLVGKKKTISLDSDHLPTCSLVIAAYNEEDYIREKIENTLSLNYPAELLKLYFVTDGSSDHTPEIVKEFPQLNLLHKNERNGKVAAMDRAMNFIDSEIVIFTDANTFLNKNAILAICKHYANEKVGGVAGEKRVSFDSSADASAAGEGMYWKYESQLKKWDSELYSVVGTAGELFSVRKSLYKPVPGDTILDDFMISMQIAEKGYQIVYEPDAFAVETGSANIKEELKRKVRISAGGIQSIFRLKGLLNPFRHPILTFQYVSHRVLRWTITPVLLILIFLLNLYFVIHGIGAVYVVLLILQVFFYGLAVLGWVLATKQIKLKIVFIPYYFCIMNYAVLAGMVRYFSNNQSSSWEKSKRK